MNVLGSDVNIEHADIKKCKNIQDLKKLDIFSHLSQSAAEDANAQIMAIIQPVSESKGSANNTSTQADNFDKQ